MRPGSSRAFLLKLVFCVVAGMLLVACPGLESGQRVPEASELPVADRFRVEAALGSDAYASALCIQETRRAIGGALLTHQQFARLETLMADLEASPSAQGYRSAIEEFYSVMAPRDLWGRAEYEYLIQRWIAARPESKYPRLLQASTRSHQLMQDLSLTGFDDRQAGAHRGSQVLAALHQASELPEAVADPEYWESQLRVSLVSMDPPAVMDGILTEVVKRDPQRWVAYFLRAYREHRHWGVENSRAFTAAVNRLSSENGPEVYAVCAWQILVAERFQGPEFRKLGLDWQKIHDGYLALRQVQPHARVLLSQQARLALACGQTESARLLLEELGDDWDVSEWGNAEAHRSACQSVDAQPLPSDAPKAVLKVGPEAPMLTAVPYAQVAKLQGDVSSFVGEERFAVLEALATRLRSSDQSRLATFYEACVAPGGVNTTEAQAKSRRWLAQRPNSSAARVARAALLMRIGWNARGNGWAFEVSRQGGEAFRANLDEAAALLDQEPLPDVYACRLRIDIARGRGEPLAVVDQAVARAAQLDPHNFEALHSKLLYLLPRWHGSREALVEASRTMMKERGDGALARTLALDSWAETLLKDLPYDLVDSSLVAAQKEADPLPNLAALRAMVECVYNHPEKALSAIDQMVSKEEFWGWRAGLIDGWRESLTQGKPPAGISAKVVEHGQYRATLPGPEKVVPAGAGWPLVPGRMLGLRLRYANDVNLFVTRSVSLTRPQEKGQGPITVWRAEHLPPLAIKAGEEELITWTIPEDQLAPGSWTLRVEMGTKTIAEQTFEMVKSDIGPEPGLRLLYQGRLLPERGPSRLVPVGPETRRVPLKLGEAFGVFVHYVGAPNTASHEWVLPPAEEGAAPKREKYDIDCSSIANGGFPASQFRYILEAPQELVPGTWQLNFIINERPVGGVTFEVAP